MGTSNLLIASVLKPVDEPRMYERFARTISTTQKFNVHVVGYTPSSKKNSDHIHFHTIFTRKRLHISRLLAPLKYAIILFKVKPKVVIVNSPELLIVTILNKIIFGYKLYYDVQENYFKNCWHNSYYPPLIKHLFALSIRALEWLAYPFVKQYFLAEQCYLEEMAFMRKKATVIENKYSPEAFDKIDKPHNEKWVVYTGTIAEHYGIFEAIDFVKKWHRSDSSIRLKIIGYCQQPLVLKKIKAEVAKHPFISLLGGEYPVPHTTILSYISATDFGILSYQHNASTANRIPTKVYEHIALETPMIIQKNSYWESIKHIRDCSIFLDLSTPLPESMFERINGFQPFFDKQEIYWKSEEKKLTEALYIK